MSSPSPVAFESLRQSPLPPLDGSLTVDQVFEWNRYNSGDLPCLVWAQDESAKGTMSWNEFGLGVDNAAALIEQDICEAFMPSATPASQDDAAHKRPLVVAILSNADTAVYSMFLVALQRLSHPSGNDTLGQTRALLPFPLSPHNSPAYIAHLLENSDVQYVYVDDGRMRCVLDEALEQGPKHERTVKVLAMPTFADLAPSLGAQPPMRKFVAVPLDTPALILHSSGSTSVPKPITLTHRTLLEWARSLQYGGMISTGEVMAVHGSPLFHAMGFLAMMWSTANLVVRAVSSPHAQSPPPVTPQYFLSQAAVSGATIIYCVPSFIEEWAEDECSVQVLLKLKALMFAGAPLSAKAGTSLHSRGVKIRCLLGATECGQVSTIPAEPYSEGYEWFSLSPITNPHFEPQEDENIFEVIFKETAEHHLSKSNTQVGGVRAYVTNDLLEQHPQNKKLWRVQGRKDDQLVLSTGEKTNPGPLEDIITKDKHIKSAIMFGRGRLQNGVIIEPISWDHGLGAKEFCDLVWPSIEEANLFAPSHSRIFREMIILSTPEKPFSYTVKGTPRRGAVLKEYNPEIEALYTAVLDSSQSDITPPTAGGADKSWSVEDSVEFARKVVLGAMKNAKTLRDTDDIFGCGCDSLAATYIRNSLLRGLRESAPLSRIHSVPSNFVYMHPSVQQLGKYISQISAQSGGDPDPLDDPHGAHAQEMDEMVRRYATGFPSHTPSSQAVQPPGETSEAILLTGSTGSLGSQILAQLIGTRTVSKIFALNRPGTMGVSSRERQLKTFLDQGIDVSLLDSGKVVFLEGDVTTTSGLDLEEGAIIEMQKSVTAIIHTAWQVDFKMMLPSFEPVIAGLRNLIDFALRSQRREPPRLIFTSSIGILKTWLPDVIPESPIEDPRLISHSGYGASKWVAERILMQAAASTPLRPVIVRVGQLSGGVCGGWNVREWFPSLVRGSQVLGCVPDVQGMVSWIPIHSAAAALMELRTASSLVYHVVHPRPVSWNVIGGQVARILKLPIVPYATWISKLQVASSRATEADLRYNPALKLVEFYNTSKAPMHVTDPDSKGAMGLAMFETTASEREAPSLSSMQLPQLQNEDVALWISYWRDKKFLQV